MTRLRAASCYLAPFLFGVRQWLAAFGWRRERAETKCDYLA